MKLNQLFIVLFLSILTGSKSFALTGGPDAFGYTFIDSASPGGPVYEWIDITEGGRLVLSNASPDEAATVELPSPVVLYGTVNPSIRVSVNGYLGSALSDSGADDSNDCPLPAQASSGSGARIYALHDDLDFTAAFASRILHKYFPVSSHPHHSCGVNVFSWHNMRHAGGAVAAPAFSFQILVFDNFDILIQFQPGNPEAGSGSTTGIQNGAATVSGAGGFGASGLGYACNSAGSLPGSTGAGRAVLFEPPSVTVNSNLDSVPATPLATTLREALLDAEAGWKIEFDAALAGETITRDSAFSNLTISDKALAIDASSLADGIPLILSGNNTNGIMTVTGIAGHLFLSSVVLTNADSTAATDIGAMNIHKDASANLHEVTLISNKKSAVRMEPGSDGVFNACNFLANDAGTGRGGAINSLDVNSFVNGIPQILINGGSFWLNKGKDGGSIAALVGLEIYGATFSSDEALALGGSIYILSPNCTIRDCAFRSSSARTGGAFNCGLGGATTIERCSFTQNSAILEGGALNNTLSSLTVTNCTFGENTSGSLGGAISGTGFGELYIHHSTFVGNSDTAIATFADHDLTLSHCLFQDNTTVGGAPDNVRIFGEFTNNGYNLTDTDEVEFSNATNDLENSDAGLSTAVVSGTPTSSYPFGTASPARDAGDPAIASPPVTDQRGFARIKGGRIDIGAVEFVGEWLVTTNVDEVADPGLGLSLREAITLADPGSTILFAAALNGTTINLSTGQGAQILIKKDLSIDADSLPDGIRISGGNAVRVFEILGSTVSLNNLTIIDGLATTAAYTQFLSEGGGIRIADSANVTMTGGAVRRCVSEGNGGGVGMYYPATLIAEGVEFTGNESTNSNGGGGGVSTGPSTTVTLRKCLISGNSASQDTGGGCYVGTIARLEVNGCTLANNTSKDTGGALYQSGNSYLDLLNTTISGNEAGVGASGNIPGGALYTSVLASGSIRHCTIANNKQRSGAGIEFSDSASSSFTISHTILSGNSNPNTVLNLIGHGSASSLGYNLTDDASVGTLPNSTDLVSRTAFIAPLGNYGGPLETHALLAISPAIDAGDPFIADAPGKDARRFARIADGDRDGTARIDIGAFEAKRPFVVSHNLDEMNNDGERSLRESITDAVSGDRILFNPSLSNTTIDLSAIGSQLSVSNAVQIDATLTDAGVIVSGGDTVRVFNVTATGSLSTHAVNVCDGFSGVGNNGGGFRVRGELLVTHACLEGNRAQYGGGIAVESTGSARLINVTISNNEALTAGGGLVLFDATSRTRLDHCTVARNTCSGLGAGGIALGSGTAVLYSTIVAENTTGGNFSITNPANYGTQLDSRGYNLTTDSAAIVGGVFDAIGDRVSSAPNLIALVKVGGWAKIHPYFAGSPAKENGNPLLCGLPVMDARGRLRIADGTMDIGAAESGGDTQDSDNDQIPDWWEQRYGFLAYDISDAGQDADGDGLTNLAEYNSGSDPLRSDAVILTDLQVTAFTRDRVSGDLEITVTTESGVSYAASYSTDLQTWTLINGFTGDVGFTDTQLLIPGAAYGGAFEPRMYFRIER
jgi:hypothetical protein